MNDDIIDVGRTIGFKCVSAGEGIYELKVEFPPGFPEEIKEKLKPTWTYFSKGENDGESDEHIIKQGERTLFVPAATDPKPKLICRLDGATTLKDEQKLQLQKDFGWSDSVNVCEIWEKLNKTQPHENGFALGSVLYPSLSPIGEPPTTVRMSRATAKPTDDIGLWMMIRASGNKLSWNNYRNAIDMILVPELDANAGDIYEKYGNKLASIAHRHSLPFTDTDTYRTLKVATEAFLLVNAPAVSDAQAANDPAYLERRGFNVQEVRSVASYGEDWVIPYLQKVANNLKDTAAGANAVTQLQMKAKVFSVENSQIKVELDYLQEVQAKMSQPLLIELIWSYWMEEMQLVQSMHAISRRFQNVQGTGSRDPLANLEADALRPLGNLLWGYVQDEQHRLTLARRAYEYSHHYGLALIGKAVPQLRPADNRSKFIEAFHNLLSLCAQFFRQADDTTVVADGFPVLNALREVHLLLSEGAGNQFRDLPATARVEMMMEQWMLARPEFREFLPRRASIAYPEEWMHSVDSMRRLQGWGDTNVLHFWHLATCGEQIVSSIRWGNWNEIKEPENASNWANFFRPEIQSYIHAYRAVTGVDITVEPVDSTMPSVHLYRRQAAGMLKRA
ncbi:MAG TPA: hypothetical protein VFF26_14630 [Gallionella sp.]|nr:hypothetical protein [Gallionella sp.]